MKRLGVKANLNRQGADTVVRRLVEWSRSNQVPLCLCDDLRDLAAGSEQIVPPHELPQRSDIILSMGGDGSLLATARLVGDSGVPILGINIGSLGFLAEQTPEDLERTLKRVIEGDFSLEERMILAAELPGSDDGRIKFALNDIVVGRGDIRLIDLALYSNGDYICSYAADGLILSTPTGSTAYSLAVGGPILNPEMDAIIASPIAPHSLTSRPLIFSVEETLTLEVKSETDVAMLTIDGQVSTPLKYGDKIRIRKADFNVKLVRFEEQSFYKVLRSKLQWGVLPPRDTSGLD
ncbi:MAG: NAD(+)/NADH kinase [candidate division Zixibacteria bacterium]|nr:NAD(+)/NADH kinase [candidate division Zixibacteria bacterium]